jgi:hypothetical protein
VAGVIAVDLPRPAAAWVSCSKSAGDAAARRAGLSQALDTDPILVEGFSRDRPSQIFRKPFTSLCGDFDRDGRTDRALLYQCCTTAAPAPWVVISRGRIVYRRLHDPTFSLKGSGTRLVTTEPRYARSDALCCPSALKVGTLRWTGRAFRRTFRIRKS